MPTSQLYPAAVASAAAPPSNTPPTVSLTAPSGGASYVGPGDHVARCVGVRRRRDREPASSSTRTERWKGRTRRRRTRISWSDVPAGSYSLTARAVDDAGAATMSAPVTVSVTVRHRADSAAASDRRVGVVVRRPEWLGREPLLAGGSVCVVPSGVSGGGAGRDRPGRRGHVSGPVDPGGRGPRRRRMWCSSRRQVRVSSSVGLWRSTIADFITVRNMETTYKGTSPGAGNQRGVFMLVPARRTSRSRTSMPGAVGSWFADT